MRKNKSANYIWFTTIRERNLLAPHRIPLPPKHHISLLFILNILIETSVQSDWWNRFNFLCPPHQRGRCYALAVILQHLLNLTVPVIVSIFWVDDHLVLLKLLLQFLLPVGGLFYRRNNRSLKGTVACLVAAFAAFWTHRPSYPEPAAPFLSSDPPGLCHRRQRRRSRTRTRRGWWRCLPLPVSRASDKKGDCDDNANLK